MHSAALVCLMMLAAEASPLAAEAQPKAAGSQPTPAEAESKPTKAEPKAAEAEPKAAEAQPKSAQAQPKPAQPQQPADAQPGITAKHHPWGRFEPGAWKLVRVTTESLDGKGTVVNTSNTETMTILTAVGKEGLTLEIHATIEVAGKRFDSEPQTLTMGFHGEPLSPQLKAKPPTAAHVLVEGERIPCRVQELELVNPTSKTVTSVFYSDTVAPYVLKRHSITTDLEGNNTISELTLEIQARQMPWRLFGRLKNAALVKSTQKHAKGTAVTWIVTVPEVPGGVVSQTSKEVDSQGRIVRRSTLELIDYGLQCEEDERPGLILRKRRPRLRESPAAGSSALERLLDPRPFGQSLFGQ